MRAAFGGGGIHVQAGQAHEAVFMDCPETHPVTVSLANTTFLSEAALAFPGTLAANTDTYSIGRDTSCRVVNAFVLRCSLSPGS